MLNLKDSLNAGPSVVGNKANNLAVLRYKVGIMDIPDCLVLGINTFSDNPNLSEVINEIESSFRYPVIARSSTNVEDSVLSFAGLFVSEVCKDKAGLDYAIREILACSETQAVRDYCKIKNVEHNKIQVAVLFQPYIHADISGVLFTKNPINNNKDEIIIEYKYSTSDAVTSGSAIPQIFKAIKTDEFQHQWPFNELINIGKKAESYFGFTVDVEWIASDGKLWIVQTRQITT
jgi:pyruvate,water dikinase